MLKNDARFDMANGVTLDPNSHINLFEMAAATIETGNQTLFHKDRLWKVEGRVLGQKYEIFPEKEREG